MIQNAVLQCLTAALGAILTFVLIHRFRVSAIRASSGLTLLFAGLIWHFLGADFFTYSALFFGATFVGMTDSSRLGLKRVLLTSQLYVLVYSILSLFFAGLGGNLGASALISCCLVYEASRLIKKRFPV